MEESEPKEGRPREWAVKERIHALVREQRAREAAKEAVWRAREDRWGAALARWGSRAIFALAFCALLGGRLACLALRVALALPALAAALAAASWAALWMRARRWMSGKAPLFSLLGRLEESIDAWERPFARGCRALGLHKLERSVDALRAALGFALRSDPGLAPEGRFWRAAGLCPYRLAATQMSYERKQELVASGQARDWAMESALLLEPELAVHAREPMGLLGFLEGDGAPWASSAHDVVRDGLGSSGEAAPGAQWLAWVDALIDAKVLGRGAHAKAVSAARPSRSRL